MKTVMVRRGDVEKKWLLVDAKGKTLGRLATQIAGLLIGKGKVEYSPHVDVGDYVVVINAKDITVTGDKRKTKLYGHYTGYPGGRRSYNFESLMARKPTEIIKRAVEKMLPKNRLGVRMLKHLRIYVGPEHHQKAQKLSEVK